MHPLESLPSLRSSWQANAQRLVLRLLPAEIVSDVVERTLSPQGSLQHLLAGLPVDGSRVRPLIPGLLGVQKDKPLERDPFSDYGNALEAVLLRDAANWQRLPPEERAIEALGFARLRGKISFIHPSMLGLSPIGWHCDLFRLLARHVPGEAERRRTGFRIGCFGAGIHNDYLLSSAVIEEGELKKIGNDPELQTLIEEARLLYTRHYFSRVPTDVYPDYFIIIRGLVEALDGTFTPGENQVGYLDQIKLMQQKLFGKVGGTSYEWRELLLQFLSGNLPGAIDVFDNSDLVHADLGKPAIVYSDVTVGSFSTMPRSFWEEIKIYLRGLERGRRVRDREHGSMTDHPIHSREIQLTDQEMQKVRGHRVDFILDPLPVEDQSFDVSVFTQTHYFLPMKLALLAWAKIVQKTKITGHILSDFIPSPHEMEWMGLDLVECHEKYAIYRRQRESSLINRLAKITP